MRILLGTNFMVGALITEGTPPDRLYRRWLRGAFDLVTSVVQWPKTVNVLTRPRLRRSVRAEEAEAIVGNIHTPAPLLHELPSVNLSHDPVDKPIRATAIAGKADLIVSGEKKHPLARGELRGIPIATARDASKRPRTIDDVSRSER